MNRRTLLVGFLVLSSAIISVLVVKFRSPPGGASGGERGLRIVVTVAPLSELATLLAPDGSSVMILMPPGRSEHGYEFTPGDLAALAEADVLVYVGLGLEPQVEQFVQEHPRRDRQDVCFARAVGIFAAEESHEEHREGEQEHDEHGHGSVDPHLWLDPVLVRELVPVLSGAIGAAMRVTGQDSPAGAARQVQAEEDLLAKIDALDGEFRAKLGPFKGSAIVTHHSAWGRLAERYGLTVAAVLRPVESAEPTPGQIAEAVEAIRTKGAKAIFVEPQFDSEAARRIADSAGVKTRTLDPLGKGEWFASMRANLEALEGGL